MKKLLCAAAALTLATGAGYGQTTAPTPEPATGTPERDARGIPVVSDPAAPPPGANQPVSVPPGAPVVAAANQAAVFTPQPATKEYPPCTKGQTDGCVQTYERGRAPK